MRTTVDLDDDVLAPAKEIARKKGVTLGRFLSDLTRQSLETGEQPKIRNGAWLLERRPGAKMADLEIVNKLRDDE
jgi:hypothetical protein